MIATYVITHSTTGSFYIGSTSDMRKRRNRHLSDLSLNRHRAPALQELYNTHEELSWDVTAHNTLEEARLDELNRISTNKDHPGILNTKFVKGNSVESIARMSQSSIGIMHTDETKLKMSEARKGVPKTKEHIDKIMDGVKKKVIVDDIEYESKTAAALANGISLQVLCSRINSNSEKFKGWQNL